MGKKQPLGGQLILATIPPDKADLNNLLNYLKVQVAKSGVKVVLNKEATPEAVKKFAPDSVIVAVGSTPFVPDIPGINGENVLNCREVLSGEKKVGKKVVVLGGRVRWLRDMFLPCRERHRCHIGIPEY